MTTYAAIKYAIPGTAITGVLKTANNLSDEPTDATARTNIGVAIGSDVQGFFLLVQEPTLTEHEQLVPLPLQADLMETFGISIRNELCQFTLNQVVHGVKHPNFM